MWYFLADAATPKLPDAPWSAISGELMQGLLLLLPGLVTVAIIQGLTVKQKLEPLERVIQALLYTFINHVTWQVFLGIVNILVWVVTLGQRWWTPSPKAQLIALGFTAVVWGLIATSVINIGWLHDHLRDLKWVKDRLDRLRVPDRFRHPRLVKVMEMMRLPTMARLTAALPSAMWFGLTKRSSRPSEWYDTFYDLEHEFSVVHLRDERRVYGWVKYYPDLPTEGSPS